MALAALRKLIAFAARCELFEITSIALARAFGSQSTKSKFNAPSNQIVDAVYLWVNDQDPVWQAKREAHYPNPKTDASSTSSVRFREFGELQASIALLAKNVPQLHKLWIVSDNQTPDLTRLGKLPFEIAVINHSDFMPPEYLPTFSSRALTANIHRIEGLAEHYLYMNDDIFVMRATPLEHWLEGDQLKLRYTATPMPAKSSLTPNEVVYNARYRTQEIAAAKGWPGIAGQPEHGPHPMSKAIMQRLWREFPADMHRVSEQRFRAADGILPEWLHNLAANESGQARIQASSHYRYVAMNDTASHAALLGMLLNRSKLDTVCLNDAAEVPNSRSYKNGRLRRRYRRVLTAMLD